MKTSKNYSMERRTSNETKNELEIKKEIMVLNHGLLLLFLIKINKMIG